MTTGPYSVEPSLSGRNEVQELVLEQVGRACQRLRPHEDRAYLECRFNREIIPIFRDAHLLGLPISSDYGDGQDSDMSTYALALERIGEEGTGVRTFFSGHISLGQLTLQKWGTREQKERYLPKASRGEIIMAFALTEPSAGSDPSSLQTTFEESGNYYVLKGSKAWISNGSIADTIITFAYPKGKRDGMRAFVVESNAEGYRTQEIENKLGLASSNTSSIFFDSCRIPKDSVLGPPGKGLSIVHSALMNGRLSVAAGSVGVMTDCVTEAVMYAKNRIQHGKAIGKHQLVQEHLGIMTTHREAAHALTIRAASLKMQSDKKIHDNRLRDEADILVAQAKYFASKVAYDAADRAVQVFGANGYSLENRVARHLADTRACRIYEGTDEILLQKIALKELGSEFKAFS